MRAGLQVDVVIMCFFSFEFIVKVIAMGLLMHPFAYLRDYWNWLDFICVVSGWADVGASLVGGGSDASALTSLRAVRVLRPLRTLTQLPGMKELIGTAAASLLVVSFFVFLFSCVCGNRLFTRRRSAEPRRAAPSCVVPAGRVAL